MTQPYLTQVVGETEIRVRFPLNDSLRAARLADFSHAYYLVDEENRRVTIVTPAGHRWDLDEFPIDSLRGNTRLHVEQVVDQEPPVTVCFSASRQTGGSVTALHPHAGG